MGTTEFWFEAGSLDERRWVPLSSVENVLRGGPLSRLIRDVVVNRTGGGLFTGEKALAPYSPSRPVGRPSAAGHRSPSDRSPGYRDFSDQASCAAVGAQAGWNTGSPSVSRYTPSRTKQCR